MIPQDQMIELARLPEAAALEVQTWLSRLQAIPSRADAPIVATVQRLARDHGVSFATFYRKLKAYQRGGWRALINRAKFPVDRAAGLPTEFISWWRTLLEAHQRDTSCREAHRKLVRQWRAWRAGDGSAAIPGYPAAPEPDTYTALPRGWSLVNLRKVGLTRYERALRRQGTMAAKNHLPSVRTTRVGLDFFSHVMLDDQWHDVLVNFIGRDGVAINRERAMRPLSFNALDVFSACDFTRAHKPIVLVDGQRRMLTEADFFWFLIHILTEFGWRSDIGTVLIHEHGTANINSQIRANITSATEGRVTFSAGGILGDPLRAGMFFEGRSRGNFKFKAHRESWFNLFRNYSAMLPGATGKDPDHEPEENYGLMRYNSMLLRAMEKLPPNRSALLQMPLLEWHQYVALANEIAELVNRRVDHDLEGWEALGHVAHEVRLSTASEHFLSMGDIAALDDPRAQQLALALMEKPGHARTRNLSPREVFDVSRAGAPMTRLNPHLWNLVIPSEYAYEATVTKQHEIIIRDRAIAPEPMVFGSLVRTARGREEIIPSGEKVRVYVNPWMPARALVCELNDAAIGLAARMAAPCRADLEGMARAAGTVAHLESHLQRASAERARGVMIEREALMRHNARVLDGAATDEEAAAADAGDDAMDAAPTEPAAPAPEPEPTFDPLDS